MDSGEAAVKPLVVVAIGGNALLRPGEPPDIATQRQNLAGSAGQLAALASDARLVVTHGNGPQVGVLALQSAADPDIGPYPLDVLDAESVGLVGYLIVQALSRHVEPERVTAVLKSVEVDPGDPAFGHPTKPIGPWYPAERGRQLAAEHGWALTSGPLGVRRVVASPEPLRVVESAAVAALADGGRIVIAAGGGGIPVTAGPRGLSGVEAVVDKDLTSSLLAGELSADRFIVLTDVDAVYESYGTPGARPIRAIRVGELRERSFEAGTMGPKVEAVCRFVERSGLDAAIGSLADAQAVLAGHAGTVVRP
jgi:carbamate kinase